MAYNFRFHESFIIFADKYIGQDGLATVV